MVDENQEEEGDGGILSRDRAQHRQLLREVVGIAGEAEATMSKLVGKLEADPGRLAQGIDFLDIKNGLLAEYNANLAYLVMRKTRGELIEGDKAVERLCYLRTMMEKIRPIEHKLKFQIDKYVNLAETGQVRPDDPTRFKANPDMLSSKLGDDEDDSEDDEDEEEGEGVKKAGQKYVAPKNVPKHFDEDKSKEEIQAEQAAKKKKSALSHSMMRELKSQMFDTPEEISHEADTRKQKYIQEEKEKAMYEEDMFTRLPVSKAEKQARRQMSTTGNLGRSLTSFGVSNFDGELGGDAGGERRAKKRKSEKGGKKKKFKIKKKKF